MKILIQLMKDKRWLAYGSVLGGALGALGMHLNEALPHAGGLSFGLPMGMVLASALGMIGGMIGGVIGSFVAGLAANEDVAQNIGESLGVGLINGFISGTAVGLAVGAVHNIWPAAVTALSLASAIAVILLVALFIMKRKKNGSGWAPR